MFTRLRMSVEEASDEFFTITEEVYKHDGLEPLERSKKLRQCVGDMLQRWGFSLDTKLMAETPRNGSAGFVVASLRNNLDTKVCFRTYAVRSQPSSPITIVEAILATCATQPAFAPVSFGESYRKREYVGVGFGANNPVQELITEAHLLFGGESSVSSLLSLGTGHPGIISLSSQADSADLYRVMRDMMSDCEQKAQDMEQRLGPVGIYSRFSVDQGMQSHHLDQVTDPGWITTQTESYLTRHDTFQKLDLLVRNARIEDGGVTLDQLKHVNGHSVGGTSDNVEKAYNILISNQDDAIIKKLKPVNLECTAHVGECMEGTREDILSEILDWTADFTAPNILWLKGYPGVGKSTIATSLIGKLQSIGRLGSSFFFKREMADAMTPRALWRRIAYDLSRRYLPIRMHLVALITANEDIWDTPNVHTLFHQLIIDPLTKTDDIPLENLPVVIIDALDECGGLDGQRSDHRASLMKMLEGWSRLPRRFKLVVTSRGESDIETLFSTTSHHLVEILAGQTAKPDSSKDIMTFLAHQFTEITVSYRNSLPLDWPGLDVIRRLTEMTGGLFIWVDVIIKFIKQGDPEQRLEHILQGNVSGGLGTLYSSILHISFPSPSAEELKSFRAILGAVILLKTPLPISSLLPLLSIQSSTMEYICNQLQSVMDCQGTLRFHHQSFVDFLMDRAACPAAFWIDREYGHQHLARTCLRTMNSSLRFNICGLKSSYIRNNDVHDLPSLVASHISTHLSYSSQFWASHLTEIAFDEITYAYLRELMHEKFLFWLEVLSLIKGVNLASFMMKRLIDWLRTHGKDTRMACDMENFVVAFANVILQSIPHIYLSALPFSPSTSVVRGEYMRKYPRTIIIRNGGQVSWPAIQKVFTGHSDLVDCVAFSPDGRRVVSGSWDRTIRIWDAETGDLVIQPLQGHEFSVNFIAVSPDGRRVVSGSADMTIRIWDAETGDLVIQPLRGHDSGVNSVAFSPNGRRIVSGSHDKTVRIWDSETGDLVTQPLQGHEDSVNSVAFAPDGRRIVSGSSDKTVRIWDAEAGDLVPHLLQGHEASVWSVAFSPDGRRIVSGSYDKTVRLWDAETWDLVPQLLQGHDREVTSVAFSPDGRHVVSGCCDGTVRIWNVATGDPVTGPFQGHEDSVWSVAFSPDGRHVASGSRDETVRIWNTEANDLDTQPSQGHEYWVTSVEFSPNGRSVVSGSHGHTVRIWDVETGELATQPLQGHEGSVTCVAFAPDGKHVASGSNDKTIRIWDAEKGEIITPLLRTHYNVNSVTFSPDGKRVAFGCDDETVRIWNTETEDHDIQPVQGRKVQVIVVAFSPDGTRADFAYDGKSLLVRGVEAGDDVIKSLQGHNGRVTGVAFSPDGKRVVSGSHDKTVRIWDAETGGSITQPFIGHRYIVTSVAFSPDGRRVISGSDDNTARIWDAETGDLVTQPLQGHEGSVTSVAFAPDGKHVASGSYDKTVRIWDAETGYLVTQPLYGHEGQITSIAFSPNGKHVVSGSYDNAIRIWNAATDTFFSASQAAHSKCGTSRLNGPEEEHSSLINVPSASQPHLMIIQPQNQSRIIDGFHIEKNGWILGPQSELLLWVPPTLRTGLYRSRNALIIGACIKTEIDFELFVHGDEWTRCGEPIG
ncbi:hypothetical protein M408DRAFT_172127 [Serendipita vermifera MAFF 305830]|uniref:Uncharacterized protein n=1 Tax=Serendipita vermifera MAFF 305830 TaxID=933852 RepID=A0A0C3AKQ2_SERVB|nr:hypothetical protein M408DRAFT_172127 [Serendipita vermifera MAFF 305830]